MAKKQPKPNIFLDQKHVENVFVNAVVREASVYAGDEYLSEMLKVGVSKRQLPRAAEEFALDNIDHLMWRLTDAEKKIALKMIRAHFKDLAA